MGAPLRGKRVLVVEDEYFIATELRRALSGAEAVVVGPTGHLAKGQALLDAQPVDLAVLDVNLEGAMSYPIADRLTDDAVPYLFLTGYDGWALPQRYADVPRLAKPFTPAAVIACLVALLPATVMS